VPFTPAAPLCSECGSIMKTPGSGIDASSPPMIA
jgi:hypothetical protein